MKLVKLHHQFRIHIQDVSFNLSHSDKTVSLTLEETVIYSHSFKV